MTANQKEKKISVYSIIHRKGWKIPKLGTEMGYSKSNMYLKLDSLDDANLDLEFVRKLGKTLKYDFTELFPELKEEVESTLQQYKIPEVPSAILNDPEGEYTLKDCKAELIAVQRKLIATQEYALTLLQKLHSQPRANG